MKQTAQHLKAQGFICTDASEETEQWVRKISDTFFQVYERHCNTMSEVDLTEYSEKELESEITGYYGSLKELQEIYGNDSNMVIAECISEQL